MVPNTGPSAVAWRPGPPTARIVRISRVVADLDRAERFYAAAMGFRTVARGPSAEAAWLQAGPAEEVVMVLGSAVIALVCFAAGGRPYPRDSRSNDLWFQHLAIVVSDMAAAYAHLCGVPGWRPISRAGPQQLSRANGGVRAFKFRDPDGHPLELIWFPGKSAAAAAGALFLTIDHSALSIAATPGALRFYRRLGLRVHTRSFNHGSAQDRLDGLANTAVRVTGLRLANAPGPGLELLAYRPRGRAARHRQINDVATDWVTIGLPTPAGPAARFVRDPDGHGVLVADQGAGTPA